MSINTSSCTAKSICCCPHRAPYRCLGTRREWVFVASECRSFALSCVSNTEAANTNLPEHTEFAATDTKMRRRLTLAAAMLQSTCCALQPSSSAAAESLAGCAGGLAKQLAVYPLDRAATRLETKKGAKATNVQQAYRGAGVLMLFAALRHRVPRAVCFGRERAARRRRGRPSVPAPVGFRVLALGAAAPVEPCPRRPASGEIFTQVGAPVKEALAPVKEVKAAGRSTTASGRRRRGTCP